MPCFVVVTLSSSLYFYLYLSVNVALELSFFFLKKKHFFDVTNSAGVYAIEKDNVFLSVTF